MNCYTLVDSYWIYSDIYRLLCTNCVYKFDKEKYTEKQVEVNCDYYFCTKWVNNNWIPCSTKFFRLWVDNLVAMHGYINHLDYPNIDKKRKLDYCSNEKISFTGVIELVITGVYRNSSYEYIINNIPSLENCNFNDRYELTKKCNLQISIITNTVSFTTSTTSEAGSTAGSNTSNNYNFPLYSKYPLKYDMLNGLKKYCCLCYKSFYKTVKYNAYSLCYTCHEENKNAEARNLCIPINKKMIEISIDYYIYLILIFRYIENYLCYNKKLSIETSINKNELREIVFSLIYNNEVNITIDDEHYVITIDNRQITISDTANIIDKQIIL